MTKPGVVSAAAAPETPPAPRPRPPPPPARCAWLTPAPPKPS